MQWLKRTYDSAGLTQHPVGPYLSAIQALLGGNVVLCLDVSGSMAAAGRLLQAIEGCKLFVTEALAAGYSVGGVLWNHGMSASTRTLSRDREDTDRLFSAARPGGGTNIVPTLKFCEALLDGKTGDLVVAIFGDGDLGDAGAAIVESRTLLSRNIRVITCGLGDASAEQLGAISNEPSAPRIAQPGDIAGAIAGMATELKRRT